MGELAAEAKSIDLLDSVPKSVLHDSRLDSEDDIITSIKSRGDRGHVKRRGKDKGSGTTTVPSEAPTWGNARPEASFEGNKRKFLPCLNPEYDSHHYMDQCPTPSRELQKKLVKDFRVGKHAKKRDGLGQVGFSEAGSSSISTALFSCNTPEVVSLADPGSDINLIPSSVIEEIN